MSPSELKKLRNKQKKAKRKAEAEKANAQQAQQRKEAHNKSQKKGPGGEDELDAPQKDELIPEKLERPQNPLEEALKFLTPLQNLAKQDIDTHFTAFEIYYRKGNENFSILICTIYYFIFCHENLYSTPLHYYSCR